MYRRTTLLGGRTLALCAVTAALLAEVRVQGDEAVGAPQLRNAADIGPPAGDEHVQAVWMFDYQSDAPQGARSAIADEHGIWVAGTSWTRADGENLWLWRIRSDGTREWVKVIARPERSESLDVVGLLPRRQSSGVSDGAPTGGVTVVLKQGVRTILRSVAPDGEIIGELALSGNDDTQGVITCRNGDLLLVGKDMLRQGVQSRAYVARVDSTGKQLWRRTVIPHKSTSETSPPEPRTPTPPGVLHHELLTDGVLLEDESALLVGQVGDYNKFGQGPSQLWLLRISGNGEKLAEAFIDDGRTAACDMVVPHEDGVVVSYTTAQLPPIGGAPYNFPPSFPNLRACFDRDLTRLWEETVSSAGMPGAVPICGPEPYVSVHADANDVVVRAWNKAGEERWRSVVSTPRSSVYPVAALRLGDDILAVCNYQAHAERGGERPAPQVMIARFAQPARE